MKAPDRSVIRSAVSLSALTVISVLLLSLLNLASRDRAEANRMLRLERQLDEVLADVRRDNDPASDVLMINDPRLGSDEPLPVYRARESDRSTALVITTIARNGYSGDIRMLVGVDVSGKVLSTRILEHRETPGIGDRIERRRSDWITLMDGRSLIDPDSDSWHTQPLDGAFDAITGATITSQAVVSAVHDALLWFQDNREFAFATKADSL